MISQILIFVWNIFFTNKRPSAGVHITNVTSANCDKNGKLTSKPRANQASTARKIADMYVTEISNRI